MNQMYRLARNSEEIVLVVDQANFNSYDGAIYLNIDPYQTGLATEFYNEFASLPEAQETLARLQEETKDPVEKAYYDQCRVFLCEFTVKVSAS